MFMAGVLLLVAALALAIHASRNELRRGRTSYTWLQVLLIVVLVLVGILLLCFNWGVVSGPSAYNRPSGNRPPNGAAGGDVEEARRKFFVDFNKVNTDQCATLVHKYFPNGASLSTGGNSAGKGVTYSTIGLTREQDGGYPDAINVPLRPPIIEAQQATTCFDPVQAAMNMNGFGPARIGGTTLASINPWMQRTQGDPATVISGWVQRCLATDSTIRRDCAQTMAAAAELIGRFTVNGTVATTSLWNYHCKYACVPNGGTVPVLELNPNREFRANFLVVTATLTANDCVVRFGWNVGSQTISGGDQRLAGLPCTPLGKITTPRAAALSGSGGTFLLRSFRE